jgi:hypothetical protein
MTLIRLCFTLCGPRAMLHARSRDGIRKDGKISGLAARAEAEGLDCRARRSGLDRMLDSQRDGDGPICGTGSNSRHGSYVRSLQDLPAQGTSVLTQATRRVGRPPPGAMFHISYNGGVADRHAQAGQRPSSTQSEAEPV